MSRNVVLITGKAMDVFRRIHLMAEANPSATLSEFSEDQQLMVLVEKFMVESAKDCSSCQCTSCLHGKNGEGNCGECSNCEGTVTTCLLFNL